MKTPQDVVAAKDRLDRADAALRHDIEDPGPTDKVRRIKLIDELQVAADDYVEKISRIRGWN
jgi:hypothetical protein